MPTINNIREATSNAAEVVAGLVATAFHPIHVSQWLVPDPDERSRIFPHYFKILVDHAIEHGTVHITPDLAAAAVWLPVPTADIADYESKLNAACGPWTGRFKALDEAMRAVHPTEMEHDYLALLAVQPEEQGRGYGTLLLRHHLDYLDKTGRAAYLEAANPRSRQLYTRHDWTDCGPTLDLPYEGDRMYPMWRLPSTV